VTKDYGTVTQCARFVVCIPDLVLCLTKDPVNAHHSCNPFSFYISAPHRHAEADLQETSRNRHAYLPFVDTSTLLHISSSLHLGQGQPDDLAVCEESFSNRHALLFPL